MNQKTNIQSALSLCDEKIGHFDKKANHNKRESLWCFMFVMAATLGTPVFVAFSDDPFWGKAVPSVLSLAASFFTAWLQLRKPQALWGLYRTAERKLEIARERYHYGLEDFAKNEEPDKLLAEKVLEIYHDTHYQWLKLIPDANDVKKVQPKK